MLAGSPTPFFMLHSLVSSGHLSSGALACLWGATAAAAGKVDPKGSPEGQLPGGRGTGGRRQHDEERSAPKPGAWSEAEKQALRGYMARNGMGGYPGTDKGKSLTATVAASIDFWKAASNSVAAVCGTAPRGIAGIYVIALKLRDGRL